MELIEFKPKKEYAKDDIKNDEIDGENINEIEQKESYFNAHNEEKSE
ncbi:hypothetical protein [Clostridium sp.]